MAKERNLKVGIVADASGLKKGLDDSKAAVRDFQRAGSSALNALDNALGGAISKAQTIGNAMRGAAIEMGKLGSAGKAAGSLMTGAMATATTAIAGLGIGAAIAGFKALATEADNFKQTVAGANIELATAAYIDTYRQVLHDINAGIGEGAAKAESSWKKFWGTFGSQLKQFIGSGAMFEEPVGIDQGTASANYAAAIDEANAKAQRAAELAREIYDLQRQQSAQQVVIANYDAQIADYRYKAQVETYSATERAGYLAAAMALINKKYQEQEGLQRQLVGKMQEMLGLANNTAEQEDKVRAAEVALVMLDRQRADELRSIQRRYNTINAEAAKELATTRAIAESRARMAANSLPAIAASPMLQPLEPIQRGGLDVGLAVHPQVEPTEMQSFIGSLKDGIVTGVNGTTVTIGIAADMSDFIDASGALNSQLMELGVNTSEIIGGLIGDLATGGDAWSNFASGAVSAFADLAISVGKMAIQTGVATLGIKAALESLNPYVAIAAGASLVALGSALKTGMSNAASGNYSASTNVASASSYSNGSSIGSDTYGREMTVKVTGRLEATGSTLAAVLDNEAQRYNRTT